MDVWHNMPILTNRGYKILKKMTTRKIAALVTCAMLVSQLSGCSFLFKGKIAEAAEDFGDAVKSMKASDIIKLSTSKKSDDVAEALDILLDRDNYSDDQNKYIDAMIDTIEVEVDKKSISVSGTEASCDIIFTMADYEKVLDEDFEDIDELVDAIGDAETTEIEFTAEFVKDGSDWLVDNIEDDEFGEIFEFLTAEFSVGDVTGYYIGTTDITDVVVDELDMEVALEGTIDIDFYLTINEDNTYTMSYDTEQIKESLSQWFDTNAEALLMAIIGVDSLEDLQDMAVMAGYTDYDEFVEDLKSVFKDSLEESVASSDNETEYTGEYIAEGNTITLVGDQEDHTGTIVGNDIVIDIPYETGSVTVTFVKQY